MKRFFCALVLCLPLVAQVKVTPHGKEKVSVEVNGQPFTEFFIGPETNKPYLHPLRAASGTVVTRGYPMLNIAGENHDHPHHRGLWFTHGDVNGYDFWGNEEEQKSPKKGKVVLKSLDSAKGGKNSGSIAATFSWNGPDGKPILTETRRTVFHADPKLRIVDLDINLKALEKVKFGDTKEGTFAIRLAAPMEEVQPRNIPSPKRNGQMVSAEGRKGEKAVWGTQSPWVDYVGEINGEKLGVTIMDHPTNPRHPTYWHSRSYGLFAANIFGLHDFLRDKSKDGSMTLEPGQTVRFRYRVVIHPGDTASADLPALFKKYASAK